MAKKTQAQFQDWMKKVDRACNSIAGVGIYDLADCDYWGMFEDGYTPREAARQALEEEGFPF